MPDLTVLYQQSQRRSVDRTNRLISSARFDRRRSDRPADDRQPVAIDDADEAAYIGGSRSCNEGEGNGYGEEEVHWAILLERTVSLCPGLCQQAPRFLPRSAAGCRYPQAGAVRNPNPFKGKVGAPEGIRTPGLCLRRAALYPAELRVLAEGADHSRMAGGVQTPDGGRVNLSASGSRAPGRRDRGCPAGRRGRWRSGRRSGARRCRRPRSARADGRRCDSGRRCAPPARG